MDNKQEIMHLKNNLDAYKLLNRDLSKKVQELKLYLNQQVQMVEVTRNELMEERVNNAKYKHFIKTNITMCSQFFSSVINNLNECIVTTDLEMSIANSYDPDKYLNNEGGEQAGPSSRVNPKISKLRELNKLCKQNAKNKEDLLYTINESQMSLSTISIEERDESIEDRNEPIEDRNESIEDRNESIEDRNESIEDTNETSEIGNESIEDRNESIEDRNESVRQSVRISTPNTSTCPALQDFQNITYIPKQPSPPLINRQNSNTIGCCSSSSSIASSINIIQDTPRKSHKRDSSGPRRLSNYEDEPLPKKKLSIEILKLSLTKQQLQEYKDNYKNNDDYEDDNESLFRSPSSTASKSSSKVSIASSGDTVSTLKASVATSAKRKTRTKAEPVKRKSSGRPKRKIALKVSLAEKSCRTKLRRSK